MSNTYRAAVLADNPLGYWRLDDVGAIAVDQKGLNNGAIGAGVTKGLPGAITGDGNTAMSFDGTGTARIVLAPVGFVGAAPFSAEAWIYMTAENNNWRGIISFGASGRSPTRDITLVLTPSRGLSLDRDGGGTAGGGQLPLNQWHHAVGTYDGATIRAYLNGALLGSQAVALTQLSQAAAISGCTDGSFPFLGLIDEAAIYGYALTLAQVQTHYQTGIAITRAGTNRLRGLGRQKLAAGLGGQALRPGTGPATVRPT